jgi:flagellar motor protein MotB
MPSCRVLAVFAGLLLGSVSGPAFSCRPTLAADAYFEYGAIALVELQRQKVLDVAAKAAPHPIEAAIVIGHAERSESRFGDVSELSMARAQYVQGLMIRAGIPSKRIYVEYKSDSQPFRPSGNQQNARVEIEIIYFPPGSCPFFSSGMPAKK